MGFTVKKQENYLQFLSFLNTSTTQMLYTGFSKGLLDMVTFVVDAYACC